MIVSRCIVWVNVLVCCFPVLLISQVTCSGTFGDNIFEEGDFGRGVANIPSSDPRIAPGYSYTTQVPPGDGFYTITNDMGRWSGNYETWISVGDNSTDPSGYMMVVNASYSPGVFYEQTIDNLCPNTTFEFSADILNVVQSEVTDHSLPDLEFLINDSVWYSTGTIPQDEQWHKHGFVFSLGEGETSLKLTLVNRAPGGIGNDLALDNITFRPCGPEPDMDLVRELFLCEGSGIPVAISTTVDTGQFAIQWQMTTDPDEEWNNTGAVNTVDFQLDIEEAGTYYFRYKLSNSAENLDNPYCVSYSENIEAVVVPREYEQWDTICMGNVRMFGSQNLSVPGTYEEMYISSQGCDSIEILHLSVVERGNPSFDMNSRHPSCHDSNDGALEVLNFSGGYAPYRYILDSVTNSSGSFEGLTGGTQTVRIVDYYGCEYETVTDLIAPPPFELFPIPDTQLILGQSLTVAISASQPIFTLKSVPDILMDCSSCNSVTFIPTSSGEVNISATNANDCVSSESFFISVDDQNLPIVFPNVFTPNGDGINDLFQMITPPHLVSRLIHSRILDKWGNVVYGVSDQTGNGYPALWDGKNKGQPAEPGVYTYLCELELINGESRVFAGEIMVIRPEEF